MAVHRDRLAERANARGRVSPAAALSNTIGVDYGGNGPSTIQGQSAIPGDSMLLRKDGSPLRARRAGGAVSLLCATGPTCPGRCLGHGDGLGDLGLGGPSGDGGPRCTLDRSMVPMPNPRGDSLPPNPSSPGGWSWVGELDFCRGGVFTVGWDLGECGLLSACF